MSHENQVADALFRCQCCQTIRPYGNARPHDLKYLPAIHCEHCKVPVRHAFARLVPHVPVMGLRREATESEWEI